jgi:hypothetical protein
MHYTTEVPIKTSNRRKLFDLGQRALEEAGWRVERVQGISKSSVRRIVKDDKQYTVSIRTTQNTWIAFPRDEDDAGWVTLDDVDYVVAVTVDKKENPKECMVFMVEGDEMRARFNRAYQARLDAGRKRMPGRQGMWVSMFEPEDPNRPQSVGGGIALGKEPLLTEPIQAQPEADPSDGLPAALPAHGEAPLTIAEAKLRLSESLGVAPDKIKILIEA